MPKRFFVRWLSDDKAQDAIPLTECETVWEAAQWAVDNMSPEWSDEFTSFVILESDAQDAKGHGFVRMHFLPDPSDEVELCPKCNGSGVMVRCPICSVAGI